jgi:hypothetical protein
MPTSLLTRYPEIKGKLPGTVQIDPFISLKLRSRVFRSWVSHVTVVLLGMGLSRVWAMYGRYGRCMGDM